MKILKKVFILLLASSIVFGLCACDNSEREDFCSHSYLSATCELPSTCKFCGDKVGASKGHDFSETVIQYATQGSSGTKNTNVKFAIIIIRKVIR